MNSGGAITSAEVEKYRLDTPGVANVLHFNNAGASLPPNPVHEAVTAHLERERQIGGYEAKDEALARIDRLYGAVAALLGCQPDEVAFIENATRAWDMAFYSLPLAEGDEIITAKSEYSSNYLAYLQLQKRKGIVIRVCPNDVSGQLDVSALPGLITPRTRLIAITHVPTQGGLVNPAAEVGKIARAHGILYLLDACQSVGQLAVDVKEIGCHMLSATGRKFLRGPRGTGFLYMEKALAEKLDPVFIDLHAARWTAPGSFEIAPGARRFENWECYYAGKLGLAVAVDYARAIGMNRIEARNAELASQLRGELAKLRGVRLTDLGLRKSAIVTFAVDGADPQKISAELRARRINVSVSSANNALLDLAARGLKSVIRASVHYYNTPEEIERFCRVLSALPA